MECCGVWGNVKNEAERISIFPRAKIISITNDVEFFLFFTGTCVFIEAVS